MEYLGVLEWIGVLKQGLTSTTNKYFVNESKTMLKMFNVHYLPMNDSYKFYNYFLSTFFTYYLCIIYN